VILVIAFSTGLLAASALSIELEVEGVAPYAGRKLEARVLEALSAAEISRGTIDALSAASSSLTLPGLVEGRTYFVDFYVDVNGNGGYDPPPRDLSWRVEIEASLESPRIEVSLADAPVEITWRGPEGLGTAIDGTIVDGEYSGRFLDPVSGMVFHYRNTETVLIVGIVSPGTGWISIGIDPEVAMQGADYIIAAVLDDGLVIQDHFGTGRFSHRQDENEDILGAAGTEIDGETVVEFAILLDSGDPSDKVLTPGLYTVLYAYHASSDVLSAKHTRRGTATLLIQ
jgi:hypothetical protein